MYGVIYAECDVRPVSPIRRSPQFMPPKSSWFALRSSGRVIPGLRGTNVLIVAQSRLAVALDLEIGCSDAHSPGAGRGGRRGGGGGRGGGRRRRGPGGG